MVTLSTTPAAGRASIVLQSGVVRGGSEAMRAFTAWLALWTLAALCLLSPATSAEGLQRIPIVLHVAEREGEAVAPASFIAEQLAAANTIYGPLGIELVLRERVPLAAAHAELVTRADRDALAPFVARGAIHCFVVGKLMDVDEPGRERRGVHWRPQGKRERSFLIVSKISRPWVLAHELGHFFGNPHSEVAGNLMSYAWTVEPPLLDTEQTARVASSLAAMLKSGRLVPLPAAPAADAR
jgi:hypothetical protein